MVEAVDLVDEQDVALFEVGQDRGQVARPLDGRAAGRVQVHAQLAGDDVGQRRLAQAGRAVEQDVIGGFLALARRGQQDVEVLLDARLADVLGQRARPKARLDDRFLGASARPRRRSGQPPASAASLAGFRAIRTSVRPDRRTTSGRHQRPGSALCRGGAEQRRGRSGTMT